MDRQLAVEEVVVGYFGTRPDIELRPGEAGTYHVTLVSPEARAQFGGRSEQILTFDAEQAFHHPDWELINATHPYLDVIRNDLTSNAGEDPRICEAFCVAQTIGAAGQMVLPHADITGPVSRLEASCEYHPHYVLTYKVIIETDERQDYLLRVCFDAFSSAPEHDGVTQLGRLALVSGRPSVVPRNVALADLSTVIRSGHGEVETRVRAEVAALAAQCAEQLEQEKRRLEQHCESELELISKRDEDGRQKLKDTLKKEIEDFERKYACRSRASLVSVLLLWTPILKYLVKATSKRSSFAAEGFEYDALLDRLNTEPCKGCGNVRHFSVCSAGKHMACGDTACTPFATCATCGDPYCQVHGHGCYHCGASTCSADQAHCRYGVHDRRVGFCPKCIKTSFEGRAICLGCARGCELCGRDFPENLLLTCSLGGERFCAQHDRDSDGAKCSECGKPACKRHGTATANGQWTCQPHATTATCCGRLFGHSHLTPCVDDPQERLCADHCMSCALCKGAICNNHVIRSWQNEPLCSKDARSCVQCDKADPRIYRRDTVYHCVVCNELACRNHLDTCAICQVSAFCKAHEPDQPACASCGRVSCGVKGCGAATSACKLCGMAYCRHCVARSGVCGTCSQQEPMGRISPTVPLLETVASMAHPELSKIARVMLKSLKQCSASVGQNRTYRVVVIRYTPNRLLFWKRGVQLRLVVRPQTTVKRVALERGQ